MKKRTLIWLLIAVAIGCHLRAGKARAEGTWEARTQKIVDLYYPGDRKAEAVDLLFDGLYQNGSLIERSDLAPLLEILHEFYGKVAPAKLSDLRDILLLLFKDRSASRINWIVDSFHGPELETLIGCATQARRDYFTPEKADIDFADRHITLNIGNTALLGVTAHNFMGVELSELQELLVASRDSSIVTVLSGSAPVSHSITIRARRAGATQIVLANAQGIELGEAEVTVLENAAFAVGPVAVTLEIGEKETFTITANRRIEDLPGKLVIRPTESGFVRTNLFPAQPTTPNRVFEVTAVRATHPHEPLRIDVLLQDEAGIVLARSHCMVTVNPNLDEPRMHWPLVATGATFAGVLLAIDADSEAGKHRDEEQLAALRGDAEAAAREFNSFENSQDRATTYWVGAVIAGGISSVLWVRYVKARRKYEDTHREYFSGLELRPGMGLTVSLGVRF